MVTVITVTLNCAQSIHKLAASLASQADKRFVWLVKDGMSQDGLIEKLEAYKDLISMQILAQPDANLYDALNQAIEACRTPFYCVFGADDIANPEYIQKINTFLASRLDCADLFVNNVTISNKLRKPLSGNGFFYGMNGFAANHSVGCLIRTSVHAHTGPYRTDYIVAADADMLYKLYHAYGPPVPTGINAGVFSLGGISTSKKLLVSLSEFTLVQIANFPRFKVFHLLLLCFKILKNSHKIQAP